MLEISINVLTRQAGALLTTADDILHTPGGGGRGGRLELIPVIVLCDCLGNSFFSRAEGGEINTLKHPPNRRIQEIRMGFDENWKN